METIDIIMLVGLVLMITALILMYKCTRGKSCRRKMEKIADSVASDKEDIDFLVKRFGYLFEEMSADHGKESILKDHAARLQELVEELEYQRNGLEADNRSMTDINGELRRSNAELVEKAIQLRDEIRQDELTDSGSCAHNWTGLLGPGLHGTAGRARRGHPAHQEHPQVRAERRHT